MKNLKNLFGKDKITVYVAEGCKYCAQVKEALEVGGIEYVEKDIRTHSEEWQALVNSTNMPVTPAVTYRGGNFFPSRDFPNASVLISILKTYEDISSNLSKDTLERIKTFNHHVNMGFSRLDKRLKDIEEMLEKKKK